MPVLLHEARESARARAKRSHAAIADARAGHMDAATSSARRPPPTGTSNTSGAFVGLYLRALGTCVRPWTMRGPYGKCICPLGAQYGKCACQRAAPRGECMSHRSVHTEALANTVVPSVVTPRASWMCPNTCSLRRRVSVPPSPPPPHTHTHNKHNNKHTQTHSQVPRSARTGASLAAARLAGGRGTQRARPARRCRRGPEAARA